MNFQSQLVAVTDPLRIYPLELSVFYVLDVDHVQLFHVSYTVS